MAGNKNAVRGINLDDLGVGDEELEGMTGDGAEENSAFDQVYDFEKIRGFELLPGGTYHFRVETAKLAMSKANEPKIACMLEVMDGEHESAKMMNDFSFSPKAVGRSKDILVQMGVLDPTSQRSMRQIAADLPGYEFWATVVVTKSTQINPQTGKVYDPRNNIVSASPDPID